MLTELRITNFAIIEDLELTFADGLTTFTGETGAGKSIIFDAIEALVGARTDITNIRADADRAQLEAVFRLDEHNRNSVHAILEAEDLMDDPDYVVLGRELRRQGRTVARINGITVNVGLLRQVGAYLVDIHGQSEHLSLLDVRQHLTLLDRFATSQENLQAYQTVYFQLRQVLKDLADLQKEEADAQQRIDLLKFQVEEIESAKIIPDEEEELKEERNRLANAENLAELGRTAFNLLDEGDAEVPAVSDLLGEVVNALEALSKIDPARQSLTDQVESISVQVEELTRDLRDYLEEVEPNPRRLEQLEERLDLLRNLKRKYGGSLESVLAHAEKARQDLDKIEHAEERIADLKKQAADLIRQVVQRGEILSQQRQEAGKKLGSAVENELADLSMAGARFEVGLSKQPDSKGIALSTGERIRFDENGFDQVEFLIAPNPGEGLKPMVKIASGGETARLMLALKRVLAQADDIPTLIFDEIDQGIGGRVGYVVGEKLWQLGRQHQVLCVTHLPQLAAFGDHHYKVRKSIVDGRTQTIVEEMQDKERLIELAQMLGVVSETHLTAAEETLKTAQQRISAYQLFGNQ
ncbi:MAG: DNA repair protein RecN [Anaerolineaceae bacterium]|nr:DNA repair protein RecN [Anaerolineaceae bacterium]